MADICPNVTQLHTLRNLFLWELSEISNKINFRNSWLQGAVSGTLIFVENFTPKSLFLGGSVRLGRVGANRAGHVPKGGYHPACLGLTPEGDHHPTKAQKRRSQS